MVTRYLGFDPFINTTFREDDPDAEIIREAGVTDADDEDN